MPTIGGKSFTDRSGGSGTPIYQRTDGGTGGSGGSSTIISEITESSPAEIDYNGRPHIFLSDPIIDFSEAFNDHSKFKFTTMDIEGYFASSDNFGTKFVSLSASFLGFSTSPNVNFNGKMTCSFRLQYSGDTMGRPSEGEVMLSYVENSYSTYTSSNSAWNSNTGMCFWLSGGDYPTSSFYGHQSTATLQARFINGKLYYGCHIEYGASSVLEKATIRTTIRQ